MLWQMQSLSLPLSIQLPMPLTPAITSYAPGSIRRRIAMTSASATGVRIPGVFIPKQEAPKSIALASAQSFVLASPPIQVVQNLGFQPSPELGLFSMLFVLSVAFGAFFSMAVVSIPAMIAFGKLGASMKKLSKVVSEEVPGTLSSLKLSSMELNELTQQLSNLRQKISGVRAAKMERSTNNPRPFQKKNPES